MKKQLFILPLLILFLTGCSLGQSNVTGPSSLNDQLDEEINGEDIGDAIDDFESQIAEDSSWLKDQLDSEINGNDINGINDMLDDFNDRIQEDMDELDEDSRMDDLGDTLDDFEERIQKDLDKLNDKIEDYDMRKLLSNFKKDVGKTLDELDKNEEFTAVSCDSISKMSTCVDYIGSFWTQQQMVYACEYSGVLSDKPCKSGSIGGCQVGKGGFNDMIIWMYSYGGQPIAGSTAKSAKPACDMNPMGNWVNAR